MCSSCRCERRGLPSRGTCRMNILESFPVFSEQSIITNFIRFQLMKDVVPLFSRRGLVHLIRPKVLEVSEDSSFRVRKGCVEVLAPLCQHLTPDEVVDRVVCSYQSLFFFLFLTHISFLFFRFFFFFGFSSQCFWISAMTKFGEWGRQRPSRCQRCPRPARRKTGLLRWCRSLSSWMRMCQGGFAMPWWNHLAPSLPLFTEIHWFVNPFLSFFFGTFL